MRCGICAARAASPVSRSAASAAWASAGGGSCTRATAAAPSSPPPASASAVAASCWSDAEGLLAAMPPLGCCCTAAWLGPKLGPPVQEASVAVDAAMSAASCCRSSSSAAAVALGPTPSPPAARGRAAPRALPAHPGLGRAHDGRSTAACRPECAANRQCAWPSICCSGAAARAAQEPPAPARCRDRTPPPPRERNRIETPPIAY